MPSNLMPSQAHDCVSYTSQLCERPYENLTNKFNFYKKKLCMHEAEMNLLVKSYVAQGHTHGGSANCET